MQYLCCRLWLLSHSIMPQAHPHWNRRLIVIFLKFGSNSDLSTPYLFQFPLKSNSWGKGLE